MADNTAADILAANTNEHSQMPNLLEVQNAIAETAAGCGKPGTMMASRIAHDHPAQVELDEAPPGTQH